MNVVGEKRSFTLENLNIPEVTREQWVQFCESNIKKEDLPDDYWSIIFNGVSESKLLLKSFNTYSTDQKVLLVRQLDTIPVKTVAAYIDLCQRAEKVDSRISGLLTFRFYEMAEILESYNGPPSRALSESMQIVFNSPEHLTGADTRDWPGMLHAVVMLLRVVYDEERLIEIFDAWKDNMAYLDPHCLILLTDKWEEASEMPIDWAVQWAIDSDSV